MKETVMRKRDVTIIGEERNKIDFMTIGIIIGDEIIRERITTLIEQTLNSQTSVTPHRQQIRIITRQIRVQLKPIITIIKHKIERI